MTRLPGVTAEQIEAISAKNRAFRRKAAAVDARVTKPPAATRSGSPGTAATPKKARKSIIHSYSTVLTVQIALASLPAPILEYRFAPPRKWRADLAYPDKRLLIEIDGMVHRIKERFKADLERDQAIFFLGWRKLRVSPAQVRSGEAVELVKRALA